jgi:hypothetical protein
VHSLTFSTCDAFPCPDVDHTAFILPDLAIDPAAVSIALISEAAPANPRDGYYGGLSALFVRTTLLAFADAGFPAASIDELLARGIYLTTAVKCAKTAYTIESGTISNCSRLLEAELAQFPSLKAILLMGDVAIAAVNAIARLQTGTRAIPAGSTYRIRGGDFYFRGARLYPSYLQAGPSFYIEKSKRKMIAEDIASAMRLIS